MIINESLFTQYGFCIECGYRFSYDCRKDDVQCPNCKQIYVNTMKR